MPTKQSAQKIPSLIISTYFQPCFNAFKTVVTVTTGTVLFLKFYGKYRIVRNYTPVYIFLHVNKKCKAI